MMGPSHRVAGFAAGLAVNELLHQSPMDAPVAFALVTGLSVLGSLLPDADEPNSTIGRALYVVWLPLYVVRGLIGVIALIIPEFKKVSKSMAHRGMAHAPLFWAAIGLALWMAPAVRTHTAYLMAVGAGILSHLITDFFFGGIPVFFPFSTKRKKPPVAFKTGGYIEFLIVGACTMWILCVAATGAFRLFMPLMGSFPSFP